VPISFWPMVKSFDLALRFSSQLFKQSHPLLGLKSC
jgi:hypothetical protein